MVFCFCFLSLLSDLGNQIGINRASLMPLYLLKSRVETAQSGTTRSREDLVRIVEDRVDHAAPDSKTLEAQLEEIHAQAEAYRATCAAERAKNKDAQDGSIQLVAENALLKEEIAAMKSQLAMREGEEEGGAVKLEWERKATRKAEDDASEERRSRRELEDELEAVEKRNLALRERIREVERTEARVKGEIKQRMARVSGSKLRDVSMDVEE